MPRPATLPIGACTAVALVLALGAGCGERREPVASYSVPKEPASPPPVHNHPTGDASTPASSDPSAPHPPMAAGPPAASGSLMQWDLPAGWKVSEEERAFRYATLVAGDGDEAIEVSVSQLAGAAGGIESNVNRWRSEVGLSPAPAEELRGLAEPIEANNTVGILFDIVGTPETPGDSPRRVFVAVFPTNTHSWFVKAPGTDATLAPRRGEFVELCRSVRFEGPGGDVATAAPPATASPPTTAPASPPSDAPGTGMAAGGTGGPDGLSWGEAPAGWSADAAPAAMSVASFTVAGDGQQAALTITPLGGAQDLLANINRWRRQVGLGAIADLAEAAPAPIEVAGTPGTLVDIAGAERRTLAVVSVRDGTTWFYKLSGPDPLVAQQREAFEQFVQSIHFDG